MVCFVATQLRRFGTFGMGVIGYVAMLEIFVLNHANYNLIFLCTLKLLICGTGMMCLRLEC